MKILIRYYSDLKKIPFPNKMFAFSGVLFIWKFTILTNLKDAVV